MRRDPRAFLWDVREAALAIQSFTAGMDAAAYAANDMVQSAAERKFEIVGEALNQLAKLDAPPAGGFRAPPKVGARHHHVRGGAATGGGAGGGGAGPLLSAVQTMLDELGQP